MKTRTIFLTVTLAVLLSMVVVPTLAFAQENELHQDHGKPGDCRHQARIAHRWLAVSAETLGMDKSEFIKSLQSGQTPAQIAEASFSNGQVLIDAIIAAEADLLAQVVDKNRLTQEKADEILARRSERATKWVSTGDKGMSKRCQRKTRTARHRLKIAAETVGIDTTDFVKTMREGQTPAEIAIANNSNGQAIVDAIVADAAERLAQAVTDGKLTQEEADARLAEIRAKATTWVEHGWPERDKKPGDPKPRA